MRINKSVSIIFMLLLILLAISCSDSTSTKKATVVGRILLEGLSSIEGVSVFLYKADVVDSELQAINNDHPSVGFKLTDTQIFDHRDYAPLYSTFTDMEGRFELKGVENEKYILVLLKEGYGPSYLYDIYVNGEYCDLSPMEPITLIETITLPQYVSSTMVFETGKTYIAEDDVVFLPESNVIFQGESILLVSPGRTVSCNGSIEFQGTVDAPIKISSSDKLYETAVDVAQFAKFEITEMANSSNIEGLLFSHSTDGMIIKSSNISLMNSVFTRNNASCVLTAGENIGVDKTYFVNSEGVIAGGIVLQDVAGVNLEDCVFYEIEKVSLNIVVGQGIAIGNSLFIGGQSQIINSFSSQTSVTNCTFINADYNITNTARSALDIQNCDLSGEICIYTYHTGNQGNSISNGWTKANYNNLNASQYTVRATAQFYTYDYEYVPLDFKNNYWGTTDQALIEQSIIDFNDLEPYPISGNIWPLIEFVPFRTSRLVNAGVQ